VGSKASELLDSGIRRGADVAKVLALGGHGVLIGRAALWGLTVAGQDGVAHALGLLAHELDTVMAYLGCTSFEELNRDLLALPETPAPAREARPLPAAAARTTSRRRAEKPAAKPAEA
jgi:isopentenyl diphosphate isomerase/L-lactate dehydrogenase-like FMN-dependent dehydrogenase